MKDKVMIKIQDIEKVIREYKYSLLVDISRVKDQIIITDYSGYSRKKHKGLGNYLKLRGFKINHIRIDHGLGKCPAILIVR